MLLGHGVDIVHVPRLLSLTKRRGADRLAQRVLSLAELQKWHSISEHYVESRIRYLAVRWSLKEAAYKALYPHFQPTWKDFTYHSMDFRTRARPSLICTSESISQRIGPIFSSVSHDGDYVFASVIVESKPS